MACSCSIINFETWVGSNWGHSKNRSFVEHSIYARGAHLVLIPLTFIASAIDIITGVGLSLAAILTLGEHEKTAKLALRQLESSKQILSRPIRNLVKTINPEARFPGRNPRLGIAVGHTLAFFKIDELAQECSRSKWFINRQLSSRISYGLLAVSMLIARAVDIVFGVVAASLSILTLGACKSINKAAFRALEAPDLIADLFFCGIHVINPYSKLIPSNL